jgi:hypothetical protein
VYGAEYTKNPSLTSKTPTSTTPTGTTPTTNTANEKNIETIIREGEGSSATRNHLLTQPASFVKTWADSLISPLEATRNRFQYGNNVYRTKTGATLLRYLPLNKNHWAKNNLRAYESEKTTSGYSSVNKGTDLGKVKNMWWTPEGLWFYMPDKSIWYKWYKAVDATTSPSSAFEGTNDHIEFSNFNNHLDLNF